MKLLTIENHKTSKGQALGYLTGILYLAPHRIAGYANLCPWSTAGCRKACLYTAGRGAFHNIQESRIIKTIHYFENRQGFIEQLQSDIEALQRKAKRLGLKPVVRLNGTSDINWQLVAPQLFTNNPAVQFYDYTKDWNRLVVQPNYDLTYSASETTSKEQLSDLSKRIAVVFNKQAPIEYQNRLTVSGDAHDLRFLNGTIRIVALTAKAKAKKDLTGFVVS
jgi:hypothetical protein